MCKVLIQLWSTYIYLLIHKALTKGMRAVWYVCICELKCSIYLASGPQRRQCIGYSTNHSLNVLFVVESSKMGDTEEKVSL